MSKVVTGGRTKPPQSKSVHQWDTEGNLVEVWETMQDVECSPLFSIPGVIVPAVRTLTVSKHPYWEGFYWTRAVPFPKENLEEWNKLAQKKEEAKRRKEELEALTDF